MTKSDFISLLKMLKLEDWTKRVTAKWTVKDVVAHMVGWEKADPEAIRKAWNTKEPPWFLQTNDYDEFNQKNVEFYKKYTPNQLIEEWEQWQTKVQAEIDRIGEKNLKAHPKLFNWLFDQTEKHDGHFNHHYRQIRKAVGKNIKR
jgi:hypothetical protein